MKPVYTGLLIGSAITMFCGTVFFSIRMRSAQIQERLLSQDFPALLDGCRDLIDKRASLGNDWEDRKYMYGNNAIVLDTTIRPFGSNVPIVITKLKPRYVVVEENRVFINMGTAPRNGINGFATNATQYGTRQLIDGLWLCTGGNAGSASQ